MYISATVSAFLDTAKTESSVLFSPYKALGAWNLRTYFYPGPISPGSKITDLRHNYLERKKKKEKKKYNLGSQPRRETLTRDDPDGDVHVVDLLGEGGSNHSRADEQPSCHHYQPMSKAVTQDCGKGRCRGGKGQKGACECGLRCWLRCGLEGVM